MISGLLRFFKNSSVSWKTRSFYEILGISNTASDSEIKKAYFSLAKQYHPDLNKSSDSSKLFSEINTAYETLIDKAKRSEYDNSFNSTSSNSIFETFFKNKSSSYKDFDSIFQELSPEEIKTKGEDVSLALEISFHESIQGVQKIVNFEKKNICKSCKGLQGKLTKCQKCRGTGFIFTEKSQEKCFTCSGNGFHRNSTCSPCQGQGFEVVSSQETVSIPAGVDSGQALRISSKGNQGSLSTGDLVITVMVKQHPSFKREGQDIHSSVTLSLSQALLGTTLKIETPSGPQSLEIPPGTCSGDKKKISGQGAPQLPPHQSKKGDLVFTFKVKLPRNLSSKEREIFKALAKEEGELTADDPPLKFKVNLK
jgi:molecular chaperone DnaJ